MKPSVGTTWIVEDRAMTDQRRSTREEPDARAKQGPFEGMTERMMCGCRGMLPHMMSLCGGVPNDETETVADTTPKA